ncbi:translocation/assembly module TamB domain-containing protein [Candidatus Fukatsuia anoeciicola]|uniref:autotransporter assembly complex protein TamB n=1 Tax=Candidatus Fukatsuia anoeciicola TaxID=2994492 RepID=UPI003464CC36
MSWMKKLSLLILLILSLLITTLIILLGTTSGIHFLVNSATRWAPGLDIINVKGGLHNLALEGIKYQTPGIQTKIDKLHLSFQFSCLKKGKICIKKLNAQNINVQIITAALPTTSILINAKSLTNLKIPYPIKLRLLTLNNVKVKIDKIAISLEELRTGMNWRQQSLLLMPTKINKLIVNGISPATDLLLEKLNTDKKSKLWTKLLNKSLISLFHKPLLPSLPNFHLPLNIYITAISGQQLRLHGKNNFMINNLFLQGHTYNQIIQLDNLKIKTPQSKLLVKGIANLSDKWPLDIMVENILNITPLQKEKMKLHLYGRLYEQLNLKLNLSGSINAQLNAKTILTQTGLPLAITLQSPQLHWPLTGNMQYQLNNFKMHFNGKATHYTLSLHGNLQTMNFLPAYFTLDGNGDLKQFCLTRLHLIALQGSTDLTGRITWQNGISWQSLLTINDVNTEKQWPQWPAKLNGTIHTNGKIHQGNWQLQISKLILDGNIKQKRLITHGSLNINSAGQLHIPTINMVLGCNRLNIKGDLNDKWVLNATINAPQLDGTLPELTGIVKGTLKLRGNLKVPHLLANIAAKNLQWQKLYIKQIKIHSNVRLGKFIQGQLSMYINQLKQKNLLIKTLIFTAKGTEKQHQLYLKLNGKPFSIQWILNGNFNRHQQHWHGSLNNNYFLTLVGEWYVNRAIKFDYFNKKQKLIIGEHCWQNSYAKICIPSFIKLGTRNQIKIILHRFNLQMFTPFLSPQTIMQGILSGQGNISWQINSALPQATISLTGKEVKIQRQIQGNLIPITFNKLNLAIDLTKKHAQINWLIKLINNGQLSGQLQMMRLQEQHKLLGNITINNITLATINPILSKDEKVTGVLNANLHLAGNKKNPLLYGKLTLDKIGSNSSWIPFKISQSRLSASFNGTTLALDGFIHTPKGQLNLVGNADWQNIASWHARIRAKGKKIHVAVPPMLQLNVSPDLIFAAMPKMLILDGLIDIPWARIFIQKIPKNIISISPDEVMLNDQLQSIKDKKRAITINSNLHVRLGSNVRLDAFNLKAQVQGALKVTQDKQGLGLNGQLTIPEGNFHTYGQDLIVKKGLLLFSGPAHQPLFNIEAIRNPQATEDNVTVGVRVTGMANALLVTIFSDPVKPELEAWSYLLRGQSLSHSGINSNMMTSMLISLGVAKSDKLIGKIGKVFGVNNLVLDTEGVGNSSQVVVSGDLTRDLQVKYGVGIFNSLATLRLRYRLIPRLYLEMVSSINQALDMIYQFDF